MPDVNVDMDLQVVDGAARRSLNVADFATSRTGAATETTAALIASRLQSSIASTDATTVAVREVRDKLPALTVQGRAPVDVTFPAVQPVALDAPSLAALETVTVANPTDVSALATNATLTQVLTELGQKLEPADVAALATDAKLEQVRALLAGTLLVNTELPDGITGDAANGLDVDVTRLPSLPAGANTIGTVKTTPASADLVEAGLAYVAGGAATTSIASPNASITLINPALSGRNVYVIAWSVHADASAEIRYFIGGTQTGALMRIDNGILGGGLASVVEVRVGAGTYTPGTEMSVRHRVNTQSPVHRDGQYFKITPGTMVTVRFIGPGATNNVDFGLNWIERPV